MNHDYNKIKVDRPSIWIGRTICARMQSDYVRCNELQIDNTSELLLYNQHKKSVEKSYSEMREIGLEIVKRNLEIEANKSTSIKRLPPTKEERIDELIRSLKNISFSCLNTTQRIYQNPRRNKIIKRTIRGIGSLVHHNKICAGDVWEHNEHGLLRVYACSEYFVYFIGHSGMELKDWMLLEGSAWILKQRKFNFESKKKAIDIINSINPYLSHWKEQTNYCIY